MTDFMQEANGNAMIDALIFDKDGTLFDFRASWGAVGAALIDQLSPYAAPGISVQMLLGYDPASGHFQPDSPMIAMTTHEIAEMLAENLAGISLAEVTRLMDKLAVETEMVPAVALRPVLADLRARGLKLGLATNDTEIPARAHLERAGVLDLFDFVAGCDSGFGGKPAPGQLLAFVAKLGLTPGRVIMVGDSVHDLDAGRAAGMHAVAVLTGIATKGDLAPHADVVLNDISQLAGWIDHKAAG